MEKPTKEEFIMMTTFSLLHKNDERYKVIRERLNTFPTDRLEYILAMLFEGKVCLDTFNYNEAENTYCPLALGLGLDESIQEPTNDKVAIGISKSFQPVNVLKATPGNFYSGGIIKRYNHLECLLKLLICERYGTS